VGKAEPVRRRRRRRKEREGGHVSYQALNYSSPPPRAGGLRPR